MFYDVAAPRFQIYSERGITAAWTSNRICEIEALYYWRMRYDPWVNIGNVRPTLAIMSNIRVTDMLLLDDILTNVGAAKIRKAAKTGQPFARVRAPFPR